MLTGTVRFGTFNTAHFFLETELVADLLDRYPGITVELVGQNSADLIDQLHRGQLEAALVALPAGAAGLIVTPVMRDELVYVSANPERLREPMTPAALAAAPLALADVSWRTRDSIRVQLAEMVRAAWLHPATQGRGRILPDHAGTDRPRAGRHRLLPRRTHQDAGPAPDRTRLDPATATGTSDLRDRAPADGRPVPRDPGGRPAGHRTDAGAQDRTAPSHQAVPDSGRPVRCSRPAGPGRAPGAPY